MRPPPTRSPLKLLRAAATPLLAAPFVAATAAAAPLPPGSTVLPQGTTVAAQPHLAGTVVEDVLTRFSYDGWFTDSSGAEPVTFTGLVTGTVQSRVVRAADHTYDFYWRISVDDASFLPVLDFRLQGLPPATYRNADFRSDGAGHVQPAFVQQGLNGDVLWAFGQYLPPSTQVRPGEQSRFLFLDTDAPAYAAGASFLLESGRDTGGSMMIQWGGSSGRYGTFMPTPVPEASTVWLTALGVLGVLAAGARRGRLLGGRPRA